MSYRINKAHLENVLFHINDVTGNKPEAWTQNEEGKWSANVGTYVLDWAYGGVQLAQLTSEGGGERNITGRGSKRETYWRMQAFLMGLQASASKPSPSAMP